MTLDQLKTTDLVNLTPHEVTLQHNGEKFSFAPNGDVARVETAYHELSDIAGFVEYHTVQGLPNPTPGTAYLVSSIVLAHISDRDDVFAPDTDQHAIRDGSGHITAVTRFLACPRAMPDTRDVFSYDFEATERTYGAAVKPYVARLFVEGGGNIDRDFFDMDRFWGTKEITVSGTYEAMPGDIIEERHGGTVKNPDVCWYVILGDREKKFLGNGKTDSRLRQKVTMYLRGNLSVLQLVEK